MLSDPTMLTAGARSMLSDPTALTDAVLSDPTMLADARSPNVNRARADAETDRRCADRRAGPDATMLGDTAFLSVDSDAMGLEMELFSTFTLMSGSKFRVASSKMQASSKTRALPLPKTRAFPPGPDVSVSSSTISHVVSTPKSLDSPNSPTLPVPFPFPNDCPPPFPQKSTRPSPTACAFCVSVVACAVCVVCMLRVVCVVLCDTCGDTCGDMCGDMYEWGFVGVGGSADPPSRR